MKWTVVSKIVGSYLFFGEFTVLSGKLSYSLGLTRKFGVILHVGEPEDTT